MTKQALVTRHGTARRRWRRRCRIRQIQRNPVSVTDDPNLSLCWFSTKPPFTGVEMALIVWWSKFASYWYHWATFLKARLRMSVFLVLWFEVKQYQICSRTCTVLLVMYHASSLVSTDMDQDSPSFRDPWTTLSPFKNYESQEQT